MKRLDAILHALVLGLFLSGAAAAQEPDRESLKQKILKKVEERIKQEEERLLKRLEKIIDEELGKRRKPAEAPKAPRARGFLGIQLGELTPEESKDLGIKGGVRVLRAIEGGPAAKAGLKGGDVIVKVDGKAIDSLERLVGIVQEAGAGTKIVVGYLREGKKKTAEVTLSRHPDDPDTSKEPPLAKEDLRERMKKFLEEREGKPRPKTPAEPKGGDPLPDDFFSFDEKIMEQLREVFEQLGIDPEDFFEKGEDGVFRMMKPFQEMLRGFDLNKLFGDEELDLDKLLDPKGAEPAPEPEPAKKAWFGVQVEEVGEELRAHLELGKDVGLLVTDVVEGSPAERAGLRKNDVLLKIDGRDVRGEETLRAFMAKAKPGKTVEVVLLRKARKMTVKVDLGTLHEE